MAPLLADKDGVSIIIHSREHLPAHVHVIYGDDEALVNIRTGEMFKGYIPARKLKIVLEWLVANSAVIEESFYELNPGLRQKHIIKADPKGKRKGGKQNAD